MRNLLSFLQRHNHWLLFIFLEFVSLFLLIRFNRYQQGVFFTNANIVVGYINELESSVFSYLNLRNKNRDLAERNIYLSQELEDLRDQLADSGIRIDTNLVKLPLIKSEVVNNTITAADNYFTLNAGRLNGVRTGQGVVSYKGVAGIVHLVSDHYAVAVSLLHSQTRLSCMIAESNYFGTLVWEQKDAQYMYLEGIPHHAKWKKGQRVITSGYSDIFPKGIIVGYIEDAATAADGLSYRMRVRLATDFGRLTDAYVIEHIDASEQQQLEAQTYNSES